MADQQTMKDIKMIYSVHKRLDYSNPEQMLRIQEKLVRQDVFGSEIGIDYLDKLSAVIKNIDMGRCIFCKEMFSAGTVICPQCEAKLDARYGQKNATKVEVQPEMPVSEVPQAEEAFSPMNEMPQADVSMIQSDVSQPDEDAGSYMEALAALNSESGVESKASLFESVSESINKIQNADDVTAMAQETGKAVTKAAHKSVKLFARKVNELAGGEGDVELRFKDLFSETLKKHTPQEAEELFICGTSTTTPSESDISASWPKPWLYFRVFLMLLAALALLCTCWVAFKNINVIPDIIFIGSCLMPLSVLIFLFETNAPRNISLVTVLKVFFVGGAASLVTTLILFGVVSVDKLDYVGALLVGIIEELGKAVIVALAINRTQKCKYIFNGILLGGAVGAGFAVFESAGYAFRAYLGSFGYENAYEHMMHNVILRGVLSPGGHVAWAAITGAGIMIALKGKEFSKEIFKDKRFISLFGLSVIMHALWDCPLTVFGNAHIKLAILIAAAWIVLIVLITNALKEINEV